MNRYEVYEYKYTKKIKLLTLEYIFVFLIWSFELGNIEIHQREKKSSDIHRVICGSSLQQFMIEPRLLMSFYLESGRTESYLIGIQVSIN